MSEFLEEQPLGYLLYRVANALRSEVTATVLEPLGRAFPQYICMRAALISLREQTQKYPFSKGFEGLLRLLARGQAREVMS